MRIQEAAEASGLPADTIRFYERSGVLPRPPRGANGYRAYTEEHLGTLRLARGLRELGLPLDDITAILAVAHDATCGEVRRTLAATLGRAIAEADARVTELSNARERLAVLRDGVIALSPRSDRLPGMAPCDCVLLASGSEVT